MRKPESRRFDRKHALIHNTVLADSRRSDLNREQR
jgi:hypothetical protein